MNAVSIDCIPDVVKLSPILLNVRIWSQKGKGVPSIHLVSDGINEMVNKIQRILEEV